MPRVSVIIPAYNSAAYLGEAVRSVQQQSYDDWEAIVADDASGDDTFAVAASFGGRVRAVRGERNRGPAGARNLALEHASGELIALLDADDAWLPSYLERQVQRLDTERARGRRVGIVACNARVSGSRQRTFLDHFRGPLEPVTLERVLRGNPIFISALVLRQAGEEAGWFSEELFGTEDHDLWIRILEQGYEAVLNHEVLAVYRQPSGSISSDLTRMGSGNQLTYQRALARGRLTATERRIARSQLRYNRAMEAVAAARFAGDRRQVARALPTLVLVAATHPRSWPQWLRVLAAR
jgi:glycosyltransferase involved in cell wall biosynthesis